MLILPLVEISLPFMARWPQHAKEGFFMRTFSGDSTEGDNGFLKVVASFLCHEGLPFADGLSAERIERIFAKHNNLFGLGTIE